MTRALLRKEWREHRGSWLILHLLFGALLVLFLVGEARYSRRGSLFELLRMSSILLATVGALFVAHRLVVREYGQRTQLFLESLPLSRTRILATKLVLGAGVLLVPFALSLLVLGSRARAYEDLTPRFLLLLVLRGGTPVLLGWAFFALAGLLGRYRTPLFILLTLALFSVDHLTEFNLSKAGPFALLGADFAFERHRMPWDSLGPCWALTGVAVALCFALVLYEDGTLAELLSQRMSHREKVFIACVFVGLFAVISMMNEEKQRKPFALHTAEQARVKGSAIQVAPGVGFSREQAWELVERLAGDLSALSDYLGLEQLPAVAVLPVRELDADVFQRAKLEKADGVVVRANLADPGFDLRAFEAFLFREVLIRSSEGTVLREDRQWLLDGFTAWWAHRDAEEPRLSPRAAVASREDFDGRSWLSTRERLGPCLAGALATRGVMALREQVGEPAFRTLMQRMLAHPPGTGLWGLWHEPRLDALLHELRGTSEEELSKHWREALRRDREARAELLRDLSRLQPSLTLVKESAETFRLEHTLSEEGRTESAGKYALLYSKLEPFENEVVLHELSRQDAVGSSQAAVLPQGLVRGERWLFVLQVESEQLGCPIRLLAERKEIR